MSKREHLLVLGVICFIMPVLLSTVCSAQHAQLSINFDYTHVGTTTVGTRVIRRFDLTIVLRNTGDATSDNITVRFTDPELGGNLTVGNCILGPNESKVFTYSAWPTGLQTQIPINVSYYPSSASVPQTPYNSGYTIFTLPAVTQQQPSTPGFELGILLLAIAFLLLRKTRKRKP